MCNIIPYITGHVELETNANDNSDHYHVHVDRYNLYMNVL